LIDLRRHGRRKAPGEPPKAGQDKVKMTAVALPAEPPKKSFRDVWLITLGHALTHWYPATFYLILPLIGNELGLSYLQIGSILTTQAAAGAIANVPGGLLVDSVGYKGRLMALSLFWIGAPYLLMGFSHDYWLLLTCAALVGIGSNLWHPTAIPLLAQRYPERRGLVVSIHGMGGNVGDAFAPLVAGGLLAIMSWREVVILNVVPGIVMSCVILAMLGSLRSESRPAGPGSSGETRAQRTKALLRELGPLLTNRTLVLLSTSSAFRSMTQTTLLTFLPVFLASQMGYSPFWIGGCMFGLQAAGFLAAPIAGYLSDTMGRRRIVMSSMATSGIVLLFMAIAGNSPVFVLLVAFLGFFLFAIRSVMHAWTLDATPPDMGGTSIGILFGVQAIGGAIGPFVGGILADRYGLIATFYFLAATIVIANLFIVFTPATETHRYAPSAAE
jgi:FSR family fosmidomycin resistance protein-like MFS transporter